MRAVVIGPRIMGKVGKVESPPEMAGKWIFQLWMLTMGSGEPTEEDSLGMFGPWETREIAEKELMKATEIATKKAAEYLGGDETSYIDLKTNLKRKWDKSDEH